MGYKENNYFFFNSTLKDDTLLSMSPSLPLPCDIFMTRLNNVLHGMSKGLMVMCQGSSALTSVLATFRPQVSCRDAMLLRHRLCNHI